MRDYITCEQCGNDFKGGRIVNKDGKDMLSCPYCHYLNNRPYKKKPRRKGVRE